MGEDFTYVCSPVKIYADSLRKILTALSRVAATKTKFPRLQYVNNFVRTAFYPFSSALHLPYTPIPPSLLPLHDQRIFRRKSKNDSFGVKKRGKRLSSKIMHQNTAFFPTAIRSTSCSFFFGTPYRLTPSVSESCRKKSMLLYWLKKL